MSAVVHVNLIGSFEARFEGGGEIFIKAKKARAMLAYLLMAPRMRCPREQLAALLWDAGDDQRARASLRQAAAALRRALGGEDYLAGQDADVIALEPALFSTDLNAMENGAWPARQTYELLSDLAIQSEPFEEWRRVEGARIRRLLADRALRELQAAPAGTDEARALASRVIGVDPYAEEAHLALFNAALKAGRRSEALGVYLRFEAMLSKELGCAPSAPFTALAQKARRRTPPMPPPRVAPAPQIMPEAAAPPVMTPAPVKRPLARRSVFEAAASALFAGTAVVSLFAVSNSASNASAVADHNGTEQAWRAAALKTHPGLRAQFEDCRFDAQGEDAVIKACGEIAAALDPGDPYRLTALAAQATAHRWNGDYDAAADAFKAVIAADDFYYNAHHGLGYTYYLKGEYDAALAEYARVREINPRHRMAVFRSGEVYFAMGAYDEAADAYSELLAVNPEWASAYFFRGKSLMALGRRAEAEADLKKAVALNALYRTEAQALLAE